MAIGQGDNDPGNTSGAPPTYGQPGEVPPGMRGSTLTGPVAGESWEDYWKRVGGGPGGSPTDFLKNLVPPDPLGDVITGEGLSPGSFLPGGGTIGSGADGTMAGAADDFWKKLTSGPIGMYDAIAGLGGKPPFGSGGAGGAGSGDFPFPYQTESPGTPTTGGLEPGTAFMQDVDMTRQGAAEQFFRNFGSGFTAPTLSQQFAGDTFSRYGNQTPGVSNNAQGVFGTAAGMGMPRNVQDVFSDTRLGVPAAESARELATFRGSTPANMDPFYENAARKGADRINRQMGARGMYGSSSALEQIGEMNTNLAAEQAKEEAQYGLSRAQLGGQLAGAADTTALSRSGLLGTLGGAADAAVNTRLGTLGNLGQGADASSLAGSRNAMDWARGLSDIFQGTDAGRVAALTSGMSAAGAAQGAQRARAQDAFGNEMAFGGALSGTMGKAYGDIFDRDMSALNDVMTLFTGAGAERFGQATDAASRSNTQFTDFVNTFGNVTRGMGGLTSGSGSPGGTAPVNPPPASGGAPAPQSAYGTPVNPGETVPGYYNY